MASLRFDEPEEDLVRRGREGDQRALATIVRALERPLYNLALRMLPTAADAEDATQEALLKIVTGLAKFKGEAKLSTWAWSVACRTCLDHRRGQGARPHVAAEEFQTDLLDGLDEGATERAEDRIYLGQLKIACARAMLQCLDAEHRLAFVLGAIVDLSGPEAAEAMAVSEATFRKRLSRARERMQAALTKCCGLVEPSARCRCHRRLDRARALGRVGDDAGDLGLDVAQLRATLLEIEDVAERAAAFYRCEPVTDLPAALRQRLRATLSNP